ncbi:MAG: bifunctional [glutamine synthetase] adenylyltransferase/[glutamine synthetase]-adenylyl-L-tyrosine phosphorylase, partial [Dongiaceae bacterium]
MLESTFVLDPAALPRAANTPRANLGLERWRERARQTEDRPLGSFASALVEDAGGRALLDAVFGNSPFLGHCLLTEPAILQSFLAQGADAVFAELLDGLRRTAADERDTGRMMQALRTARRRVA